MESTFRRRLDPAMLLVALLVAVNLAAVLGLVTARRDARLAVREALELETRADARALEARLASEYAGLEFLARSPPFRDLGAEASQDPVVRRWARLELEATLLLYLQSRPAVVRLRIREGADVLAVARRDGDVPTLAAPDDQLPLDPWLLRAAWPLGSEPPGSEPLESEPRAAPRAEARQRSSASRNAASGERGELEAWVDPRPLLADLGTGLELHRTPPGKSAGPLEAVSSDRWTPPMRAWLERTESESRVLGAVERLAGLFRNILVLNVALLPATLLLGALTVRRIRRLARLESDRRQKSRLHTLELQVQHTERLASLGRFAAGTAHEINNPLAGMSNYLRLLREDLEAGDGETARQWLPRLEEGIERVAGIVRQVLHFAEPGAAALEPVVLGDVIERTALFLRRHPECREASIEIDCRGELRLEGDAVGLGQLVLNLVLNACQAQSGDDKPARVEILGCEEDEAIVLRILDRGPGIAEQMRDRLFEPFQSGRGSSGLGLAVCHGIVSRHGGSIEALDRRPGPGTEMRVRLPRRPRGVPPGREESEK